MQSNRRQTGARRQNAERDVSVRCIGTNPPSSLRKARPTSTVSSFTLEVCGGFDEWSSAMRPHEMRAVFRHRINRRSTRKWQVLYTCLTDARIKEPGMRAKIIELVQYVVTCVDERGGADVANTNVVAGTTPRDTPHNQGGTGHAAVSNSSSSTHTRGEEASKIKKTGSFVQGSAVKPAPAQGDSSAALPAAHAPPEPEGSAIFATSAPPSAGADIRTSSASLDVAGVSSSAVSPDLGRKEPAPTAVLEGRDKGHLRHGGYSSAEASSEEEALDTTLESAVAASDVQTRSRMNSDVNV